MSPRLKSIRITSTKQIITTLLFFCFLLSLVFLFTLKVFFFQNKKFKNIPPGPPSLPILGNLHQQNHFITPFTAFLNVMVKSFLFGSALVSWWLSRRRLRCKNASQRKTSPCHIGPTFSPVSMSLTTAPPWCLLPTGDHWPNLRRITALKVFSTHSLNKFMEMRRDEMKRLVQKLAQVSQKEFAKVEMRSSFSELTFNTIMRMISDKRYWEEDCVVGDVEESRKLREIIKEMVTLGGTNNLADFLPILRLFDYGNLEKRLKSLAKRTDGFLQGLIDEHRNAKQSANTMIDHLLSLQESQPEYYTDQIIKGLILVSENNVFAF